MGVECGAGAANSARGWEGYLFDDDEAEAVAFYCPACTSREFDFDGEAQ